MKNAVFSLLTGKHKDLEYNESKIAVKQSLDTACIGQVETNANNVKDRKYWSLPRLTTSKFKKKPDLPEESFDDDNSEFSNIRSHYNYKIKDLHTRKGITAILKGSRKTRETGRYSREIHNVTSMPSASKQYEVKKFNKSNEENSAYERILTCLERLDYLNKRLENAYPASQAEQDEAATRKMFSEKDYLKHNASVSNENPKYFKFLKFTRKFGQKRRKSVETCSNDSGFSTSCSCENHDDDTNPQPNEKRLTKFKNHENKNRCDTTKGVEKVFDTNYSVQTYDSEYFSDGFRNIYHSHDPVTEPFRCSQMHLEFCEKLPSKSHCGPISLQENYCLANPSSSEIYNYSQGSCGWPQDQLLLSNNTNHFSGSLFQGHLNPNFYPNSVPYGHANNNNYFVAEPNQYIEYQNNTDKKNSKLIEFKNYGSFRYRNGERTLVNLQERKRKAVRFSDRERPENDKLLCDNTVSVDDEVDENALTESSPYFDEFLYQQTLSQQPIYEFPSGHIENSCMCFDCILARESSQLEPAVNSVF